MGFFSELGDRVVGGPSILTANFAYLAEDVRRARDGGAELLHFDAMDNHFVPNLIPTFLEAGVSSISIQPEAVTHLHRTLEMIRNGGAEAGVAINPTTSPEFIEWALPYLDFINVMSVNPGFGGQDFIPEMADKVRRLKEMTDLPIEVDGGINAETGPQMVEAGAQVLVAGSAVYKGEPEQEMRRIIESGRAVVKPR
jgi:ribulose-phosphate 3-epimerase